ncbi:MAG: metallophosphoesterase family protein [Hyphomicrobiaceae bacterium]
MLTDLTPALDGADRILVFGGPYSNLQATRAMRMEAGRLGIPPEHMICTGDVVAYCAHPVETIAEIRNWGVHVIAGNCEQQLAAGADDCACGFDEGSACDVLSKGWYDYANRRIGLEDRTWMAGLPEDAWFTWAGRRFRVVHGACDETSRFVFASESNVIEEQLARCAAGIVIAGHSGLPFGQRVAERFWINAGVIGQPANDGTPDGWYGILNRRVDGITFSLHRLSYNAEPASQAVLAAGYADPYGDTLLSGVWPNHDILPEAETAATGVPLPETTFVLPAVTETQEAVA